MNNPSNATDTDRNGLRPSPSSAQPVHLTGERQARPGELTHDGQQAAWRGITVVLPELRGTHISDYQFLEFIQARLCAYLDCTPAEMHWRCSVPLDPAEFVANLRRQVWELCRRLDAAHAHAVHPRPITPWS